MPSEIADGWRKVSVNSFVGSIVDQRAANSEQEDTKWTIIKRIFDDIARVNAGFTFVV
jgi:hypothetical protein